MNEQEAHKLMQKCMKEGEEDLNRLIKRRIEYAKEKVNEGGLIGIQDCKEYYQSAKGRIFLYNLIFKRFRKYTNLLVPPLENQETTKYNGQLKEMIHPYQEKLERELNNLEKELLEKK